MHLTLSTHLDWPPTRVWREVRTSKLFLHICRPLVTFVPVGTKSFPETWEDGGCQARMFLLGFLPIGQQAIAPTLTTVDETPGRQHYEILENGHGSLVSRFTHRITIKETEDGSTRYTDSLDIGAGLLTPLIWAFTAILFRWRQRRWRELVRKGFDGDRG